MQLTKPLIVKAEVGHVTKPRVVVKDLVCEHSEPRLEGAQLVLLSDEEGYRSFLRHLLAEGIVAPPDPVVLDVIMERQAQRVGNNANRLHEPSVMARHDRDAALLEQMEAAKAKLEQAPAPAPRRRRG